MKRCFGKLLGVGLFLLCIHQLAQAIPAPPFPFQVKNADGSSLWIHLRGDEYLSWAEDVFGYAVAKDPQDGFWYYATLGKDGMLVSGTYRVGSVDPETRGIPLHLKPSEAVRMQVQEYKRGLFRSANRPVPRLQGTLANLVLLVKFADKTPEFTVSDFNTIFNGSGNTVKTYYEEVSYNQFHLTSTVQDWIALPHNQADYAWNQQYEGLYGPGGMVTDALDHLNSESFPFANYDLDNDQVLDAIDVIHTGYGYEYSGDPYTIHSHFSPVFYYLTHDNIAIYGYHTEPEYRSDYTNITQIGVIVHETGHFFGLEDLYDYGGDSGGLGYFCLMSSGSWAGPDTGGYGDGTVPTHLCAYGKTQLGFVTPNLIQASVSAQILHPVEGIGEVVKLNTDMPYRQYFLMEDRQRTGFDQYLPASGLLIFHVDETQPDNNNQNRYRVDLEQADGLRELNNSPYENGNSGDAYPYGSRTSFTPTTTPNSLGYGQSSGGKISVLNIARSSSNITFDVVIGNSTGSYLAANPTSLAFAGTVGGSDPAAKTLQITHQGTSALTWTAAPQAAWLHASPTTSTTPSSTNISVTLTGLSSGRYTSKVRFTAPNAANTLDVPVQLDVSNSPPVISVDPTSLGFSAEEGTNPDAKSVRVTNIGGGTLTWSATLQGSWFSLSASSGTAPTTVQVIPDIQSLSPGDYTGSIEFSGGGSAPVTVAMSLTVFPVVQLAVSPTQLVFDASVGGPSPAAQSLSVSNSASDASMNWSATTTASWVSFDRSSGVGNGALSVTASLSGLSAGNYLETITVSSPQAKNGSVQVDVQLNLAHGIPTAPTLISPENLSDLDTPSPEFTIGNAKDPEGSSLSYTIEVYKMGINRPLVVTSDIPEGPGGITTMIMDQTLEPDNTYEWRAKAVNSRKDSSPWSERWTFIVIKPAASGGCGCAAQDSTDGAGFIGLLGLLGLMRMFGFCKNQ